MRNSAYFREENLQSLSKSIHIYKADLDTLCYNIGNCQDFSNLLLQPDFEKTAAKVQRAQTEFKKIMVLLGESFKYRDVKTPFYEITEGNWTRIYSPFFNCGIDLLTIVNAFFHKTDYFVAVAEWDGSTCILNLTSNGTSLHEQRIVCRCDAEHMALSTVDWCPGQTSVSWEEISETLLRDSLFQQLSPSEKRLYLKKHALIDEFII